MNTMTTTIADTIVSQLGGVASIRCMTGRGTRIVTNDTGIRIVFQGHGRSRDGRQVKGVDITLSAGDTYEIATWNARRGVVKMIDTDCGIYAWSLAARIRDLTGLELRVPRVYRAA